MNPDRNSRETVERSRLRWRCRRGMRELDVLLERWLDRCWADAEGYQRAAFERLLATEDDELWAWATGRERPADAEMARVLDQAVEASSR